MSSYVREKRDNEAIEKGILGKAFVCVSIEGFI
jgi:hypothetical protein